MAETSSSSAMPRSGPAEQQSLLSLQKDLALSAAGSRGDEEPLPLPLSSLRRSGALRLITPAASSPDPRSYQDANDCLSSIAAANPSAAIVVYIHYAVMCRLKRWASTDRQAQYLAGAAEGNLLAASAWTEMGGDGAHSAVGTTAVRTRDGWTLTGSKTMTTGSGLADVYLVLAAIESAESGGAGTSSDHGLFLVDADNPGVSVGRSLDLAGMKQSATGNVSFQSCSLPPESLLAPPNETAAVKSYPHACGLTLGAVSMGIMRSAFTSTVRTYMRQHCRARERDQEALLSLVLDLHAVEGLVQRSTSSSGDRTTRALVAKVAASETSMRLIAKCQSLLGSRTFVSSHPLNALMQDARAITLMGPPNALASQVILHASLSQPAT